MGYLHNPIEPSDWAHGPADEPEFLTLCPQCGEDVDDEGTGTYKCTECNWQGPTPTFVDAGDYEPPWEDC